MGRSYNYTSSSRFYEFTDSYFIFYIESNPNFTEMILVEATSLTQNPRCIYIGHIDELHDISTLPALAESSTNQVNSQNTYLNSSDSPLNAKERVMILCQGLKILECQKISTELKTLAAFMILYMKIHEQASTTKTKKRKTREQNVNYMREYRASIASTEENEKFNYYS